MAAALGCLNLHPVGAGSPFGLATAPAKTPRLARAELPGGFAIHHIQGVLHRTEALPTDVAGVLETAA